MSRRVLIEYLPGQSRVAFIEDDCLVALKAVGESVAMDEATQGDIFWGRVRKIMSGLQAAFVDLGTSRDGFLGGKEAPGDSDNIAECVTEGEAVLVQVRRPASGTKGASLTSRLSIGGTLGVLTPGATGLNVSRKIEDEAERDRLRAAVEDIIPEDCGFIVRTEAEGAAEDDLRKAADALLNQWKELADSKPDPAPRRLTSTGSLWDIALDDIHDFEPEQIIVDNGDCLSELKGLYKEFEGEWAQHTGKAALFEAHEVEEELETVMARRQSLPGGGILTIERTEACTTIDVDSSGHKGTGPFPVMAMEVNKEALQSSFDLIFCRNLSGQFAIDLITLKNRKDRETLEHEAKKLSREFGLDMNIHGFSRMGMFECSRPRSDVAVDDWVNDSPTSQAFTICRQLLGKTGTTGLKVSAPQAVMTALQDGEAAGAFKYVVDQLGYTPELVSLEPAPAFTIEG